MANQSDTFTLQAPLEDVWNACEGAVLAMGWKTASKVGNIQMVCKEAMGAYLLYTMPATIEVRLSRVSPTMTQVDLKGSNFGIGPITNNHVKGHMSNMRRQIENLSAPVLQR